MVQLTAIELEALLQRRIRHRCSWTERLERAF